MDLSVKQRSIGKTGGNRRFYVIAKAGIKGIARVDQGVIRLGEAWVKGTGKDELH